jgi:hypothetical protein
MYNVAYDAPDGVRHYLRDAVPTRELAEVYRAKFAARYVGKPYPNGRGWYPFTDPRVVRVR